MYDGDYKMSPRRRVEKRCATNKSSSYSRQSRETMTRKYGKKSKFARWEHDSRAMRLKIADKLPTGCDVQQNWCFGS